MKAVVLTETGVPPVDAEFDEPVAGEGQVVVEMAAAAIHHVDLARASGSFYLGPPPLPSVLGNDGVGRLPDGRRVFVDSAVVPFGTWAERALAGTDSLLDAADGVDDATAAALANTGLTACQTHRSQPGSRPGVPADRADRRLHRMLTTGRRPPVARRTRPHDRSVQPWMTSTTWW
jgi:NADPH:quinone reductase-like Zn-dependent oxidoreductase